MRRSLATTISDSAFIRELGDAINQIPRQTHAAEVTAIVREVAGMLGCNGAVFASFTQGDEDFESYRYIVACAASWCNLYVEQRWFAIDPFLIYAQHHTEPAVGDEIPLRTEGQRQFRQRARETGFNSIAIVPCHTAAGRSRMGVLYLTSEDPDYFTRQTIAPAKMCLRSIAAELLEWWSQKIRRDLLHNLSLREDELKLLRLAHQGFGSKEIARLFDTRPATIDQRFARLSLRLNVPTRAMAAKLAYESGLFDE
jgi:DNA-binding CsgD family transcriptional regulator